MSENGNAQFTEQIEVSLDLSTLQTQLDGMVQMYQDALGKLGENGPGIINTTSISAFQGELGKLSEDLKSFTSVVLDTFNTITDSVAEAVTASSQKVRSGIRQVKEEADAALPSIEERTQKAINAIRTGSPDQPSIKPNTPQEAEIFRAVDQMIGEEGPAAFAKLTDANLAWYNTYSRTIADAQNRMEEFYSKERAEAERNALNARVNTIKDQYASVKDDAKFTSSVASKTGGAEATAAAEQTAKALKEAAAALNQAKQGAKELDEGLVASAEAAAKTAAETAKIQRGIAESVKGNPLGSFFGSITRDIAQTLGSVVKFQLAWGAVGVVINGVMDVIKAPIVALEDGVKYLNEMQEKADELAGVIAGNVQYSKNFVENFREAQVVSEAVVQQLRQISASDHLPFQGLQQAFQALVENGAGQMTKSMKDVVGLTEVFALAMQASGKSATAVRSIISEIPKLMSGNVTGAERLLTTLGITKDQWVQIRAEAMKHGDLLDRLASKSEALRTAVREMGDSQHVVLEELRMYVNETEAFFARALWEKFGQSLLATRNYLKDHREIIDGIARVLGDVVVHLANALEAVAKSFMDLGGNGNVPPILKAFIEMASLADRIAIRIEAIGKFLSIKIPDPGLALQGSLPPGLGGSFFKDKNTPTITGVISKAVSDDKKVYDDEQSQLAESRKREKDLLEGKTGPGTDIFGKALKDLEAALNKSFTPTKNTPEHKVKDTSGEELAKDNADLENQLANAEAVKQKKIDDANELYAQKKITEKELHDQVKAALSEEFTKVELIVEAYKKLVDQIKGLDATKKATAKTQADTKLTRLEEGVIHGETANDDKFNNSEFEAGLQAMRAASAQARKEEQQRIEEARLGGRTEADIAMMVAESHRKAAQDEENILQTEIAQFKANLNAKKALVAQYNNEVKNAGEQEAADQKRITDARLKDELRSAQDGYKVKEESARAKLEKAEKLTSDGHIGSKAEREAVESLALDYQALTENQLTYLKGLLEVAKLESAAPDRIRAITEAVEQQTKAVDEASNKSEEIARNSRNHRRGQPTMSELLFGVSPDGSNQSLVNFKDFGKEADANGDFTGGVHFDLAVKELQHAFEGFSQSAKQIAVAFSGNNALAGAAAVSSTAGGLASAGAESLSDKEGALGGIGKALGVFGPIASIGGSIIGLFSQIFTAEAQHIADNIKKAFDQTVIAYQNGAATLTQTLSDVEAQRQEAISKLSGQKGGQDQLNKLLPQLDQQIAQLQNQKSQIIEQFSTNLEQLRVGAGQSGSPLASMLDTWTQINKQVQEYIGAGGNAKKAIEALSLTLRSIKTDAWTNLNQGETTAIQDAIQLNSLLQQRIDLENSYEQQVNGLLTSDSVVRRASQGVSVGMKLQEMQADHQLQLTQLNAQIALGQSKVNLEREVFNIASSTSALEAQANQAALEALQQKLVLMKQYAEIYSNIYQGPGGAYHMNPGFAAGIGAVQININGSGLTTQQLQDAITKALNNSARYGGSTSYSQFNN